MVALLAVTPAVLQHLAVQSLHADAKHLRVVAPPNRLVAAKPQLVDAPLNRHAVAKHQLVVAPQNQLVVAKHLLADVLLNRHVAAKPLADVQQNRLAVAKFLPADAERNVADCWPACSANTNRLAVANRLAVVKHLLAAKAPRRVVAKLPLLADATAVATRDVAAAKRSVADC